MDSFTKNLVNNSKLGFVEYYEGKDGYLVPMKLRMQKDVKEIRQVISGELAAKFHSQKGFEVQEHIASRKELGIKLRNLIRFEDKDLKIEQSDSDTLKETRILPKGFNIDTMIATFEDYSTITGLKNDICFGIVIKDKLTTESFNSMFEMLWNGAVSKKNN